MDIADKGTFLCFDFTLSIFLIRACAVTNTWYFVLEPTLIKMDIES